MTSVHGSGLPVTVVAHGLGGSVAETRPLLSGVRGTKVFAQARGHGDAPTAERPGWDELVADLRAVADTHGATQALGVSLGAGTLLRLLAATPDRFARVVLFLPASVDTAEPGPVRRGAELLAALDSADPRDLERAVRAELPADLAGDAVAAYVAARTSYLRSSDLAPLLRALQGTVPVADRRALTAVTADVLLLAQEDDPVHPVAVARELSLLLPRSRLEVFPRPGVLFRPADRVRLRKLVVAHLTAPTG